MTSCAAPSRVPTQHQCRRMMERLLLVLLRGNHKPRMQMLQMVQLAMAAARARSKRKVKVALQSAQHDQLQLQRVLNEIEGREPQQQQQHHTRSYHSDTYGERAGAHADGNAQHPAASLRHTLIPTKLHAVPEQQQRQQQQVNHARASVAAPPAAVTLQPPAYTLAAAAGSNAAAATAAAAAATAAAAAATAAVPPATWSSPPSPQREMQLPCGVKPSPLCLSALGTHSSVTGPESPYTPPCMLDRLQVTSLAINGLHGGPSTNSSLSGRSSTHASSIGSSSLADSRTGSHHAGGAWSLQQPSEGMCSGFKSSTHAARAMARCGGSGRIEHVEHVLDRNDAQLNGTHDAVCPPRRGASRHQHRSSTRQSGHDGVGGGNGHHSVERGGVRAASRGAQEDQRRHRKRSESVPKQAVRQPPSERAHAGPHQAAHHKADPWRERHTDVRQRQPQQQQRQQQQHSNRDGYNSNAVPRQPAPAHGAQCDCHCHEPPQQADDASLHKSRRDGFDASQQPAFAYDDDISCSSGDDGAVCDVYADLAKAQLLLSRQLYRLAKQRGAGSNLGSQRGRLLKPAAAGPARQQRSPVPAAARAATGTAYRRHNRTVQREYTDFTPSDSSCPDPLEYASLMRALGGRPPRDHGKFSQQAVLRCTIGIDDLGSMRALAAAAAYVPHSNAGYWASRLGVLDSRYPVPFF
eukprot:TRINITY_DN1100_c1_g1_i1.p1 TRINITY_DN1100_c1_g1~~TRINITY_DN1100_c1_g1_i1.p1  ORF type:complete len:693 (-),score=215.61 TRINITY_DN1100_c1_g1_i1:46-2124(-)